MEAVTGSHERGALSVHTRKQEEKEAEKRKYIPNTYAWPAPARRGKFKARTRNNGE